MARTWMLAEPHRDDLAFIRWVSKEKCESGMLVSELAHFKLASSRCPATPTYGHIQSPTPGRTAGVRHEKTPQLL